MHDVSSLPAQSVQSRSAFRAQAERQTRNEVSRKIFLLYKSYSTFKGESEWQNQYLTAFCKGIFTSSIDCKLHVLHKPETELFPTNQVFARLRNEVNLGQYFPLNAYSTGLLHNLTIIQAATIWYQVKLNLP